ncbi:MAG: DUF6790 family protein [Gammaproteobacteria bacterium]
MAEKIIHFILGNMNIWTPILAIIIGFLNALTGKYSEKKFCGTTLSWFLLLVIGLMGLEGFIMHVFYGDFTAQSIGWQNSPFQYEVGVANLSFGVLGILAFFIKKHYFRLATIIGFSIWFIFDGIGHVYQLLIAHDTAPYNAGTTLYTDFILPIIGMILIACSKRK